MPKSKFSVDDNYHSLVESFDRNKKLQQKGNKKCCAKSWASEGAHWIPGWKKYRFFGVDVEDFLGAVLLVNNHLKYKLLEPEIKIGYNLGLVVVVVVVVELFIINDLKRRAFIMKIVNGNVHYH